MKWKGLTISLGLPLSALLAFSLLTFSIGSTAHAHNTIILQCLQYKNVPVTKAVQIKATELENGFYAEIYDIDGDGKPDVVTYSMSRIDGTHADMPTFYELDTDQNNVPDILFIDIKGDGECENIRLYDDYDKANYDGHKSPSEFSGHFLTGD